jgi:putative protease
MGIIELLKKHFPRAELHLSTQANCLNKEAVKLYKTLGFSRIVLGREASLNEIRAVKDAVPGMKLEAFAHGAMCVSYSGRCLLSAALAQRSANAGNCAHSCRWDFRALTQRAEEGGIYLEEKERAGEFFPVFEGEGFTALLSSKDLCMINRLEDMKKAGVDCVKIEGRMKSAYYTAVVTRSYRKALDALEGKISQEEAAPFAAELFNTPHREFTTAFYYSRDEASQTAKGITEGEYTMMGFAGKKLDDFSAAALAQKNTALLNADKKTNWNFFVFESMNKMYCGIPLEVITPNNAFLPLGEYMLICPNTGGALDWVSHGHGCLLYTAFPLEQGHILRAKQNVREAAS